MAELVQQILSLPKAMRIKIAMQILLSIQEEEDGKIDWHSEELAKFQKKLKAGEVTYFSEEAFWAEASRRAS